MGDKLIIRYAEKIIKLKQENKNLKEELSHLKKAGACNACEAVGEENVKLRECVEFVLDQAKHYQESKVCNTVIKELLEECLKEIGRRVSNNERRSNKNIRGWNNRV